MKRLLILLGVIAVLAALLAIAVRIALGGDRIKAAIESQATIALGQPVTIRTASPRFFPRVSLDLDGIAIGSSREVRIERVRLATGLRALVRRRVEEADVSVEESRIDVRWALALMAAMAGEAPGAKPPAAPSSYALTVDSVRTIALRDVTLMAGDRALLVNLDGSFTGGDRLVIREMRGASDASTFTASGELASVATRTGTFTVDAADAGSRRGDGVSRGGDARRCGASVCRERGASGPRAARRRDRGFARGRAGRSASGSPT